MEHRSLCQSFSIAHVSYTIMVFNLDVSFSSQLLGESFFLANLHFGSRIGEACIGVIGIQDICHFTSRDIGYYPFYFQGYRILCSISGILCFFAENKKTQKKQQ